MSKADSERPAVTVRELIRSLRKSNPDGLVFLDSDSNCLVVVTPRGGGMHQSFDEDDQFTAEDRKFLLRLRIV